MKTVVLVPFRGDGAERTRNWEYSRAQLDQLGWPIITANGDVDGRFCRSHALNAAAWAAGDDWDVAFIIDADIVLAHPNQARLAVGVAREKGCYAVAHHMLHYLTERGTEELLSGMPLDVCEEARLPIRHTWESARAVSREMWNAVGGMDERFIGYGGEGLGFYYAAATLGCTARVPGAVYHLAHSEVTSNPDFNANMELVRRYRTAMRSREAMEEVLTG